MRPSEPQIEQVRELLAPRSAATGRRRTEYAVTARWLRALRSRTAAPRGGSRPQSG
jgi:hypothetical protein